MEIGKDKDGKPMFADLKVDLTTESVTTLLAVYKSQPREITFAEFRRDWLVKVVKASVDSLSEQNDQLKAARELTEKLQSEKRAIASAKKAERQNAKTVVTTNGTIIKK